MHLIFIFIFVSYIEKLLTSPSTTPMLKIKTVVEATFQNDEVAKTQAIMQKRKKKYSEFLIGSIRMLGH